LGATTSAHPVFYLFEMTVCMSFSPSLFSFIQVAARWLGYTTLHDLGTHLTYSVEVPCSLQFFLFGGSGSNPGRDLRCCSSWRGNRTDVYRLV